MKRLLLLLLLVPMMAVAQTYTISGTIIDHHSGETLIGATVLDTRSGKGAVTNLYGHYSLTLKSDSVNLRVTFVGYEPQYFNFKLTANKELNVRLRQSITLKEVTITAERTGDKRSSQMSAMQIPVEVVKAVPVLFGEADIIKALQLMPGGRAAARATAVCMCVVVAPTRTSSCSTGCRCTTLATWEASSQPSIPTPSRMWRSTRAVSRPVSVAV